MRESKIKGTIYLYDPKSGKMVKAGELGPEECEPIRQRTESLASQILEKIGESYLKDAPLGRARVLEVLNALAMTAGLVIKGCDDPAALEYFSEALNKNLKA